MRDCDHLLTCPAYLYIHPLPVAWLTETAEGSEVIILTSILTPHL